MRKSVTRVLLTVASVLLVPMISYAAGLGKMTVRSALGQPLDAEIEVVSLQPGEEDSFVARLASRDALQGTGVEFSPVLAGARFSIERQAGGKSVIRIRTTQPVNDPILSFMVELQWPNGRLAREYTVLVDPLEYKSTQTAAAQQGSAQPPAAGVAASQATAPASAVRPATSVTTVQKQAPTSVTTGSDKTNLVPPQPAVAPQAVMPSQPSGVATVPGKSTAGETQEHVAAAPAPVAKQAPEAPPPQSAQRAPRNAANAAVAEPRVPERRVAGTYQIKRGDTLGTIARKWKPAGVTLNQMLIALYEGNRHVFIHDNINLIRAGEILTIPAREQAAEVDAATALRQVRLQIHRFAKYRRNHEGTFAAASLRTVTGAREGSNRRVAVRRGARSL